MLAVSGRCLDRHELWCGHHWHGHAMRRPPASALLCSSGSLALFSGSAEPEPWMHLSCSFGSNPRSSYPRNQFLAGVRRRTAACPLPPSCRSRARAQRAGSRVRPAPLAKDGARRRAASTPPPQAVDTSRPRKQDTIDGRAASHLPLLPSLPI